MKINNFEIDATIIACLGEWKHQVKTALIIGSVIYHFDKLGHIITENEVAERIYWLAENGEITAFGDIKKWRKSEIMVSNI